VKFVNETRENLFFLNVYLLSRGRK